MIRTVVSAVTKSPFGRAALLAVGLALSAGAPSASGQLAAHYRGGDIGGDVTFVMRANPGDTYINILSITEGPTCFPPGHPVGCIDVDLHLFWISFIAPSFYGVMPPSGEIESKFTMPADPLLDGFLLKSQVIRVVKGKLTEKSNLCRVLFTLTDTWHDSVGTVADDRLTVPGVTLDDGRVLLAGGAGTNFELCEIYDPWLQEFSPAASMNQGRNGHSVTKLADGKILAAGGSDVNLNVLSSAEVYDPALNTWTTVGPMASVRVIHTASLLSDGRVLVTGGSSAITDLLTAALSAQKTTEYYDPTTQAFSAGPNLARPHSGHSAVTLASGDVLIASGGSWYKIIGVSFPEITNKAQVYSTAAGTLGSEINMKDGRAFPGAVRLDDGRVLFCGGIGGPITSLANLTSAELFDPTAVSFSATGSMTTARSIMSALLLPSSHQVLVAGGATGLDLTNPSPTDAVERFDPAAGVFVPAAKLALPRAGPASVLLESELAVLIGGALGVAPAALYRE